MLDQLKYLNLCSQLISSCYLEMRFIVTKKVIHHTQNIALNQCNSASSWLNLKILVENVNIYFFVDPMFYFLECIEERCLLKKQQQQQLIHYTAKAITV